MITEHLEPKQLYHTPSLSFKCFVQYLLVPFILLVINVISFKIQTKGIESIHFAQAYRSTCTPSYAR